MDNVYSKICLIFLVVILNFHPGIKHIITVAIVCSLVPIVYCIFAS